MISNVLFLLDEKQNVFYSGNKSTEFWSRFDWTVCASGTSMNQIFSVAQESWKDVETDRTLIPGIGKNHFV